MMGSGLGIEDEQAEVAASGQIGAHALQPRQILAAQILALCFAQTICRFGSPDKEIEDARG